MGEELAHPAHQYLGGAAHIETKPRGAIEPAGPIAPGEALGSRVRWGLALAQA